MARAWVNFRLYEADDTWAKGDNLVKVWTWPVGEGGEGAGAAAHNLSKGGGGQGGGAGFKEILEAALGATEAITVGNHNGNASAAGQDGNPSSFGSHIVANGGKGGGYNATGQGTPGSGLGSVTGADKAFPGINGPSGMFAGAAGYGLPALFSLFSGTQAGVPNPGNNGFDAPVKCYGVGGVGAYGSVAAGAKLGGKPGPGVVAVLEFYEEA